MVSNRFVDWKSATNVLWPFATERVFFYRFSHARRFAQLRGKSEIAIVVGHGSEEKLERLWAMFTRTRLNKADLIKNQNVTPPYSRGSWSSGIVIGSPGIQVPLISGALRPIFSQ